MLCITFYSVGASPGDPRHTKRNIDNYRQDYLLRYRRMQKNNNGSVACEENKAVTMMEIDETTSTLVRQSFDNLKSIETYLHQIDSFFTYLVERAARRTFSDEVTTLL